MPEFIIIGAGLAGSVIAERISSVLKSRVLVIERKTHFGGLCFDQRDENRIIVHRYGPHLFHTADQKVVDYLSAFTNWRKYEHQVRAFVDGKIIPLPFNFNSIDLVFNKSTARAMKKKLLERFAPETKVPILELRREKDPLLIKLADYIYEKVFLNYSAKQWEKKPEELSPQVTARVPVLIGTDNRYFSDPFQAVPEEGYSSMFFKMLASSRIEVVYQTDFTQLIKVDPRNGKIYFQGRNYRGWLIYTGMIDQLFSYKFGPLSYRSLRLDFETIDQEYLQPVATVNYPNDFKYTRITEFKHIHPQHTPKTTILKEYPQKFFQNGSEPFYPLFTPEAQKQYTQYSKLSSAFDRLLLVGRLAEYRYYNMDEVVSRALELFQKKLLPQKIEI